MSRAASSTPQVPNRAGTLGMWLLLISLMILFLAAMVAYLVIRVLGGHAPPLGTLQLPPELWISTALVLGVSAVLTRAVHEIRRERLRNFRNLMVVALLLAIGFVAVQTPALMTVLRNHNVLAARAGPQNSPLEVDSHRTAAALYGAVFALVLIHALHVIGGIVALLVVVIRSRGPTYDHEHYLPIRHTAMYWHFLDIVWVIMFATFQVLR